MGWGIKIPEIGLDTGEFVGGDIGNTLTNISREANTPIGRAIIGGVLTGGLGGAAAGLLTTPGLFDYKGPREQGANLETPKSRWDSITNGYTTDALPQAGFLGNQQSGIGKQTALNTLGQYGGQAVGAQQRLDRASRWGQASGMADISRQADTNKLQTQMQGITDIELPIQQGRELAQAQADAIRRKNGGSAWGLVGTIGGAALGGAFGGPVGASMGASIGGGLGQNLGSR